MRPPVTVTPSSDVIWSELRGLRDLIAAYRDGDQKALAIQAAVYEHRLDTLNHANAEAMRKNAEYLPRETYEAQLSRLEDKIATLNRIVYIGMGVALAGETLLYFLIKT